MLVLGGRIFFPPFIFSFMDNSKILVVSDVHCRSFWRKVIDTDYQVVFLGDYMDPYPQEGLSVENGLKEFKDIITFAKMEPDRVTLLIGNHMLHYVGLSDDTCRFSFKYCKEIYNLMKENQPLFLNAFKWGNTLFTHAGVTNGWLKQNDYKENPNTITSILNNNINFTDKFILDPCIRSLGSLNLPIGDIGRSRGGYAPYGSPAWADVTEMYYNSAFKKSLIQIFGHTQLIQTGTFLHRDNWYMCDSRAVFIWDGKELKVY